MARNWPHPLDPEPTPREARRIRVEFVVATIALIATIAAMLLGPMLHAGRPAGEPIYGCRAVDGDTLRCGRERVRLLGIDAPEMPGHCRRGRRCVDGDPVASKARLAAASVGPLRIVRVGRDHYGRTLASVSGRQGDLSCWQLAGAAAQYRPDWDNGHLVARQCRSVARRATLRASRLTG